MILVVCAVKDSATDTFGKPFFVHSLGQAMRSFKDEVMRSDPNNELFKHPDDFTLWSLCDFDDQTGQFATVKTVCEPVFRGKDVVNLEVVK